MVEIEKTNDCALIKRIFTHPGAWEWMRDDFSPPREEWEPIESESVIYLAAKHDSKVFGLFALVPDNAICWKVHVCMLPAGYGALSREAFLELFRWVWQYTRCLRLVGYVAESNRKALKLALDVGMQQYGTNPDSWLKDGKLQAQVLLGISKPCEAT